MQSEVDDKIQPARGGRLRVPLAGLGRGRSRRWVEHFRNQMPLVLLVLLIAIGSRLSDVFLTPDNFLAIVWATSVLGIVALGQTLLLITCNFDMSVGYVVGLAGILAVIGQNSGVGLIGSILIGLAAGMAWGLLNGGLVVLTRANPFLITLGTGWLAYAISLTLTKSMTQYVSINSFTVIGQGRLAGTLYYSVLLFLILAVILELVLRRARFGRSLYVLGVNETAGRLSGLRTRRIKLIAFVACGTLAAVGGIVVTSRNGSTVANVGVGMDFNSIIAAVLGGTSLFGGTGGTLRTVVGVLVLGVLNNLLILLNVPYEAQQIATGGIFLVVVWADSILRVT